MYSLRSGKRRELNQHKFGTFAAKTYFSELFLSQTQPLPSVKRVADSGLRFAVGKY